MSEKESFFDWLYRNRERDDAVGRFYVFVDRNDEITNYIDDIGSKDELIDLLKKLKFNLDKRSCGVSAWNEYSNIESNSDKKVLPEVETRPVVSTVHRQFKRLHDILEEDERSDMIAVRHFVTTPAELSREAGVTVNLGDYQSLKVTVGLKMPCYPEEVDEANLVVKQWVDGQLDLAIENINKKDGQEDKGYDLRIETTKLSDNEKENIVKDEEAIF